MRDFESMATHRFETVDCRMLQLELEFYRLALPQVKALAELLLSGVQELVCESFYVDWRMGGRKIQPRKLPEAISKSNRHIDYGFCGDVVSNVVYNAKTYSQYDKQLRYDVTTSYEAQSIPQDYPEQYREIFANIKSPQDCKRALLGIFNATGKRMMALWRMHDLVGGFSADPYIGRTELFHGEFHFRVASACLGNGIQLFADKLVRLLCRASSLVSNLSGRVALSPIPLPSPCSGHMEYFGDEYEGCDELRDSGYEDHEWLPYYYLRGAEWFNILSPLQQAHLPVIEAEAPAYPDLVLEQFPEGGMIVRSVKNIAETDIPEYLSLKKLLYNALYPGKSEMLLSVLMDPDAYGFMAKPRRRWEYVPVWDEEITVLHDRIVFSHVSKSPL